jgi:hypothetical protein
MGEEGVRKGEDGGSGRERQKRRAARANLEIGSSHLRITTYLVVTPPVTLRQPT